MPRKFHFSVVMVVDDEDQTDAADMVEILTDVLNGKRGPALDWVQGVEDTNPEYRPIFTVRVINRVFRDTVR